jgi:predicted DCC family thiol-disulfide oxidoreductase YuxK
MAEDTIASTGPIIVFDGVCILCSANAQFVLDNDRAETFRLASIQGAVGTALMRANGLDPGDPETIIVIDGARVFRDSDAILEIYDRLGWPWRALAWTRIIPRSLRDAVYRFVARNRYRVFGKREACWLPLPAHAARILD